MITQPLQRESNRVSMQMQDIEYIQKYIVLYICVLMQVTLETLV